MSIVDHALGRIAGLEIVRADFSLLERKQGLFGLAYCWAKEIGSGLIGNELGGNGFEVLG